MPLLSWYKWKVYPGKLYQIAKMWNWVIQDYLNDEYEENDILEGFKKRTQLLGYVFYHPKEPQLALVRGILRKALWIICVSEILFSSIFMQVCI
jgi:hypothetical protein